MVRIWFLFCVFYCFSSPSYSKEMSQSLSEQEIGHIESYLNALTSFQAAFTQISSDGSQRKGTFYLSRPGKLRWEYDAPNPIVIVAKSGVVAYYDKELDEVSHVTNDVISQFLTRPVIHIPGKDLVVVRATKREKEWAVTFAQLGKQEEGTATLVFSQEPLTLRRFEISDSQGQTTRVNLDVPSYGIAFPASLFAMPHTQNRFHH